MNEPTGADTTEVSPFPNYLEIPTRVPLWAWRAVRFVGVAVAAVVVVMLFVRPAGALFAFWRLIMPLVPMLLILAPGLWRNLCPLATVNQTPRLLAKTRALVSPKWLQQYGYVIAVTLFVVIVVNRKVVFNTNGPALGVLLIAIFIVAFVGGATLKGKAGWCSSMCPILPVQRIYGQTPFVLIRNTHCEPCVGCTKNCYDFNPTVAYDADMYDDDPAFVGYRRWFVGLFPGFVLAYFQVPAHPPASLAVVYGHTLTYALVSLALFLTLEVFTRNTPILLPALFGAGAFVIYYWFIAESYPDALGQVLNTDLGWLLWPIRIAVVALAVVWVVRTIRTEHRFVEAASAGVAPVRIELGTTRALRAATESGRLEVTFQPGEHVVAAKAGASLLEVAESAGMPIEAGCRMGVCGADPVHVVDGIEHLSPITKDEASTLERLGLGGTNRLACTARVSGACTVACTPDQTSTAAPPVATFTVDPAVRHVVVIGGGIGGITTADFVRRHHPDATIDVIGREAHQLYNRMGISRLIYGRSAMRGLYLLPQTWHEQHRITSWLNTLAVRIDREGKQVVLGTGETLPYDRLVIATGSRSTVPDVEGIDRQGCFVLREAEDAIDIRRTAQQAQVRTAVVAGGGLLGIEAAHALHELGLEVTVLERSERLLRRSLDVTGSAVLGNYLESLGIDVVTNADVTEVRGGRAVEQVVLTNGRTLPAGVLVVAAGTTPNVELAAEAGLTVARGIVVDAALRTSDPDIFAVGDVAEFDGRIWGLWPVAVEQAQVAATNVVGGTDTYRDEVPMTILKGVGLDVLSFGRIEAQADADVVITDASVHGFRHRKVVVHDGRVVGGVFLGYPDEAQWARTAHETGADVSDLLDALRVGIWPTGIDTPVG